MKKSSIIVLSLILLIALIGCGKQNTTHSFQAIVTEVTETTMLVRPVEGSNELHSADLFGIALKAITDNSQPKVGDTYKIVYNGDILETYPGSFVEIKSVTLVSENK